MPIAALAALAAGALSSGLNAYGAKQDRKAAEARREKADEQISEWERQAEKILKDQEKKSVRLSSASDVNAYKNLRSSYNPDDYTVDYEQFDKTKYNVEDYLNPNRDAILADVAKASQHTAAGAGLGHSSGAIEAINRAIIEKDENLYDKAYDRMKDDRSFDYGAYTDYINQTQKKLDSLQQGVLTQMNLLRDDIQFDQQNTDAVVQNKLSLGNSIAQSRAQLV